MVVLTVPETAWELGRVPLRFQLGELVLCEAHLSLLRRSARLGELPLPADAIPDPPPCLDGANGYVVWSQPIARRLPVMRVCGSEIVYAPRQYRRFSIDLTTGFAQYMAGFSGKSRSGLRRKMRKFSEASGGAIDWRQYCSPAELQAFFPLARAVSATTYQERLLELGLPATETFVDTCLALAKEGKIRAFLLFLHGRPISYLYCPVQDGVVFYDHLGYDPSYAELSPGTVLQLLALEVLFAESRFTTFDFTEGEGQHKELFATDNSLCGDIFVLKRNFTPAVLVSLHYVTDMTSTACGRVLGYLNVRSRARRLVRSFR